ncbi:MAG: hypothetical protein ACJ763_10925 [Bdellovibrionia bacterium]
MKQNGSNGLGKAAIVGGITGIRSTAALSQIFDRNGVVRTVTFLESVADKLPFIPARTQVMSLLGRAGFGGYAASLLADEKRKRLTYATVGALSAIICTFAATQIRTRLGAKSRIANTALGFAEDGIVSWAGRSLRAA